MWTTNIDSATDRTFRPAGFRQPGVARWEDRAAGIAVGYPWVTLSVRPPTKESRIYKVSLKVGIPRLATTSPSTNTGVEPAPSKAYENQAHFDFLLHERSTREERVQLFNVVLSWFAENIMA
jgi:hypothetical protein